MAGASGAAAAGGSLSDGDVPNGGAEESGTTLEYHSLKDSRVLTFHDISSNNLAALSSRQF